MLQFFFYRCLILQIENLNLATNLNFFYFYVMLITCKCMSLCKKLDCDAKSEPPYLATIHLHGPTIEVQKVENLKVATQVPFFFCKFVTPIIFACKGNKGIKLLMDYNQSHVVTFTKYFEFLWKKMLKKKVVKKDQKT